MTHVPSRHILISAFILLAGALGLSVALDGQVLAALQPGPVTAAWQQARAAGSYRFAGDILQQTIPSATVGNVGRTSHSEQVYLEGQTDLLKQKLELSIWSDGGSVALPASGIAVRVEDGKTFTRRGAAPWQEGDNLTAGIAPAGDFMHWLAAVKDVTAHKPETRAGIRFTRYSFRIDGAVYAAHMRDRLEAAMRQQGELPPGVHLDLPPYYRQMTGTGELWIGGDGLPLRQLLKLHFPEQNAETVHTQIKVDFFDFGKDGSVLSPEAKVQGLAAWPADFGLRTAGFGLSFALLSLLALAVVILCYRRSRLLYHAVAISVIFSLVSAPLLSNIKLVSFLDTQAAKAAAQEESRKELDQRRAWQAMNVANDFNPHESPVAAAERAAQAALLATTLAPQAALLTDTGADRDGDGLTDFLEERLGTALTYPDSDEDLINDGVEVAGYSYAGQQWYTDPNAADSNHDGLTDLLEQDANGDGQIDDTDADGVPDQFDSDNDADGVPDSKDIAPLAVSSTFAADNPLLLTLRNLEVGKPAFVNFQVRPQDAKNLWFAHNVLDWPQDSAGQVRDIDGKSYADWAAAHGRTAQPSEAWGDMKLVPMLEIRTPIDDPNLPPTSDLTPYNITNNHISTDGRQRMLYVPLNVITDEQTGARVAFSGQMRYRPSGSWPKAHEVRLVWAVQTLTDVPCDPRAIPAQAGCQADGYLHNQPQVVQSYYDDWQLTGATVREDHGTSVAIAYEDPAVDTNLQDDAPLWLLAGGLNESFIGGRDQDNDGQRDITLAEIVRRFERTANGGVSETERWALPNVLRVERKEYTTFEQALASTTMTETLLILNRAFEPAWQGDKTIMPLLLYAQEARQRSVSLNSAMVGGSYASLQGNVLTLDLQPGGEPRQPLQVQVSIQWNAFCAPNASSPLWSICDPAAYWQELERRHFSPSGLAGDPHDINVIYGRIGVVQLFNLAMRQGVTRIVESENILVSSRYSLEGDSSLENLVRPLLQVANLIVMEGANYFILARYYFKIPVLQFIGEEVRELGRLVGGTAASKHDGLISLRGDAIDFAKGVGLLGLVAAGLLALVVLSAAQGTGVSEGTSGAKALRVFATVLTIALALVAPLIAALEFTHIYKGTASKTQLWNSQAEHIKYARGAAAIGAVFTSTAAWGFFLYSMIDNQVSAFSPQFNSALAEVIAATIYAILIAILFATIIGVIIAGVIAVIDAILTTICELGVSDLRKVPGLGGACFTLGTAAIKVIAKFIYSFDVMVDTERRDLAVTGEPTLTLADPNQGFIPHNGLTLALPVTTTIVHKDPALENLHHLGPYLWFFSADNLRSTAFAYSLSVSQPLTLSVNRGDIASAWQDVAVDHSLDGGLIPFLANMYRGRAVSPHGPVVAMVTEAGLNRPIQAYLNMGYALPAYECWNIPNPLPVPYPRFIPVCYSRSLQGHNSSPLAMLQFDYFPSTLTGFMTLADKGNGGLGLHWDPAFGALADADGDGLAAAHRNGLDPNDATWDADGDGLADAYELERRQAGVAYSPVQVDTDNDGLTDLQEAHFHTNPAIADTDNDGLTDGEEVWHRHYDPTTGAATDSWAGGWNVTLVGQQTLTVRVSSNPLDPDGDGDSVSDQAEMQLALDANPANRVDNQNRPFHPLVFNTPPVAVYTAVNDADRYVTPGQNLLYTSTVVANTALAPGTLEVMRPAALGGTPLLYALPFNPSATGTQTVTQPAALAVATDAAAGALNLLSTARVRLPSSSGPAWVFDPIATGTLGGFTDPARWADVAFSRTDRQDSYRIAGLVSLTGAQRDPGDIWSYLLPAGSGAAIEDDSGNTRFLRGNTPPGVACNHAGVCLVAWDHYDNCNTLTINSLKVVTAGSDHGTSGIEPFINQGPTGTATRLWDWTHGGGTPDMRSGDQRGPHAFGFPVTVDFCGSVSLFAWESDSPTEIDPVGSHTFAQGEFYTNQPFTFSGSGHTYELHITIPRKDLYVLGGTVIKPDGTRLPVTFPNPVAGVPLSEFRPVVASDGVNFVVTAEQAQDNATSRATWLMLRRYDQNGSWINIQRLLLTDNRTAPLTSPNLAHDLIWRGDGYRIVARYYHSSSLFFQDYNATLSTPGSIGEVANNVAVNPDLPEISLAYDPLTDRDLLAYKSTDGWLAGKILTDQPSLFAPLINLSAFTPAYRPSVAWNPVTKGWMASWTNNAGNIVVAPLKADGTPLVAEQAAFTGLQTNALACPAPNSSPLVDLRFEELPGATTFADSSGYGTTTTCSGAACPLAGAAGAPHAPLSDYALQFDGVDDFTVIQRKVPDDFSIAFWLRTTGSGLMPLLDSRDPAQNPGTGITISRIASSVLLQTGGASLNAGTAVSDGQWHMVVATRAQASGQIALYVDGVQTGTALGNSQSLTTLPNVYVGRNSPGFAVSHFNGAMDHLQIFPVALAADTVAALYNRTLQAYCVAAGTKLLSNVEWGKLTLRQPDDRGGRISASGGLSLTVDLDAPSSSLSSLQNNGYIQGSTGVPVTLIIGGSASDATAGVARVEVSVNDGAFQPAAGAETWTYPLPVTEGRYTLKTRATDVVGNVEAPGAGISVIADGTPPQVGLDGFGNDFIPATRNAGGLWSIALAGAQVDPPSAGQPGSGVQRVEVLVQAQNATGLASTWQTTHALSVDRWMLASYTLPPDVTDPTGSYTVTVRAVDKVGNVTPAADQIVRIKRIDAAGPDATLSPTAAVREVISQTLTLTGLMSDTLPSSGLDKVEIAFTPVEQIATLPAGATADAVDALLGASRTWLPVTLAQQGASVTQTGWSVAVPAGLEGQYQIDLRGYDLLGNRRISANVWRGVIDTADPRLVFTAQATGRSYFDAASNQQLHEVAYLCTAEDRHLDGASFSCPGSGLRPPQRQFADTSVLQSIFPDVVIRNGLAISYTVWLPAGTASATLRACDLQGRCASATAASPVGAANSLVSAALTAPGAPNAVIVAPTAGSYVAANGVLNVTIAAEAGQSLKEVILKLDGAVVNTLSFAQNEAVTSVLRTLATTPTGEGAHTLEVAASDWAGSTQATPFVLTFTLDTQPPTAQFRLPDVLNEQNVLGLGSDLLLVEGIASDSIGLAAVQVRTDDNPFADAEFAGNGSWRLLLPVFEPAGRSVRITVRALDFAGHSVESFQDFQVNLSGNQPPDTAITGTPGDPSATNTVEFSFTGTPGANEVAGFECQIDDGVYTACNSPHLLTGLSKGTHSFRVRAIASTGQVDPTPASVSWTVPASALDVTITSAPSHPTSERTATFVFTGNAASYECSLDGAAFTPCSSGQSYSGLADGGHTFLVRGRNDTAVGTPARHPWTVANAAPVAQDQAVNAPAKGGQPITLVATDSDPLAYHIGTPPAHGALIGVPPNLTYLPDTGFSGADSFTFRASDSQTTSNLATVSITVQAGTVNVPPETAITKQPANPSGTEVTFEFTGTDDTGIARFECSLDGAAFAPCTSPQPYTGLAVGSHTFQVRAVDTAGSVDATPAGYTWSVQSSPGTLVGTCGTIAVYRTAQGQLVAPGWTGAIKVGTAGNNTISGGTGADLMLGLGGNDRLDGKGGDDLLCSGEGVDLVLGAAGKDYLDGGPGNDVLNGGAGDHDILSAGEGNDVLLDGDGVLSALGGPGNDLLTLALRNGWRNDKGAPHFTGLAAGYGNDAVGLAILGRTRFYLEISGDEPGSAPDPLDGTNDSLVLAGLIDSTSLIVKFERRVGATAASAAASLAAQGFELDPGAHWATLTDESGAEFLSEPVGGDEPVEAGERTDAAHTRIFLPIVTKEAAFGGTTIVSEQRPGTRPTAPVNDEQTLLRATPPLTSAGEGSGGAPVADATLVSEEPTPEEHSTTAEADEAAETGHHLPNRLFLPLVAR